MISAVCILCIFNTRFSNFLYARKGTAENAHFAHLWNHGNDIKRREGGELL